MHIRRMAVVPVVCAALAACVPPTPGTTAHSGSSCHLAFAASLPLTLSRNGSKLSIPVTVEGTRLTMILDTGSEGILLTEAAAHRASRTPGIGSLIGGTDDAGRGFVSGIGGSSVAYRLPIADLALGRMHGAFDAQVSDQVFHIDGEPVDGLIGMSVLDNFDVDLDIPGRELRLYATSGTCDAPAVALGQPLYATKLEGGYASDLREMVPVTIDGHPFNALLDTGSPGILLFAHAAAELGLSTGDPPADARRIINGVGGRSHVTLHRLDALTVGPLTLRHVVVAADSENATQADLLLGLDFMKQVHVWLSNSSHNLVLQYPPAPSPPLALN